jgi:hypothetical protein
MRNIRAHFIEYLQVNVSVQVFIQVSCLTQVHHGGAGTVAAGLKAAVMLEPSEYFLFFDVETDESYILDI